MSAPRAEKLAILLVEDRAEDVELLDIALRRSQLKFELHTEASIAGARAELSKRRFDVVLTDYSLPDGDGTEIIVASRLADPEIPVLMISGTLGEDFAVSAMRAGAVDYLLKSQFSRLPAAIERAVEAASLRRERVKALVALEESREQLASIVDSAMDSILTVDESERIVLFNHAAELLFGCPQESAIGSKLERFIPLRYRAAHHDHMKRFAESGITRRRMGALGHVAGLREDGTEFVAEASISQLVRGGVRYFTVILRDVSERFWADEERRRLTTQFLNAQRAEGLGLVAAGVAHDFNNLLSATTAHCEVARNESAASEGTRDSLDRALSGLRQMGTLARQLLSFAGHAEPKLETVRVAELARELGDLLRNAPNNRVRMDFDLSADTPSIEADRSQILQLLLNLALNAGQACAETGGRVEISTRKTTIERGTRGAVEPGEYCEIRVRDDGCGMDDATKTRIFEPFFTTKAEGKGLGLAAVAGIAKNHGARVEVESAPGAGSTFKVLFRSARNESSRAAKPSGATGASDILLIDDEPLVLEVMTMILQNRGYRVTAFESSSDAVAAFAKSPQRFDLAIIDLTMPVMDGFEVGARIRKIRPSLPIVLTSGYARGAVNVPSDLSTHSTYLEKPFSANDLLSVVRGAIGETLVASC